MYVYLEIHILTRIQLVCAKKRQYCCIFSFYLYLYYVTKLDEASLCVYKCHSSYKNVLNNFSSLHFYIALACLLALCPHMSYICAYIFHVSLCSKMFNVLYSRYFLFNMTDGFVLPEGIFHIQTCDTTSRFGHGAG